MKNKKKLLLVLSLCILMVTNGFSILIVKNLYSNKVSTEQANHLSYEQYTNSVNTLISNLKETYPNIYTTNITLTVYPGDQKANESWVNSKVDAINNDAAYPKKRAIYISNTEKTIVTKVTFNFEPKITDKLYLSVNRIYNKDKTIKNWNITPCSVFSNSITTNGLFIQIVTTGINDIKYDDEFENKMIDMNTEVTSKLQNYIIQNKF